jgi:hypothetical protein
VATVRSQKWRLVLFLVVETLAVAAMIGLLQASRPFPGHEFCQICKPPSGDGLLLGIVVVLAELAVLAAALKMERGAWPALLGLGLCSYFTAMMILATLAHTLDLRSRYTGVFAAWHLAAAVLLVGVGLVGAVCAGWRRLGRSVEERQRERGIVA